MCTDAAAMLRILPDGKSIVRCRYAEPDLPEPWRGCIKNCGYLAAEAHLLAPLFIIHYQGQEKTPLQADRK